MIKAGKHNSIVRSVIIYATKVQESKVIQIDMCNSNGEDYMRRTMNINEDGLCTL